MLEESAFNNCSSTSNGGSVYFFCLAAGQFVQERTCYHSSIAPSSLAFRQQGKPDPSSINYAFFISVSKCGESESKGDASFYIACGNLLFANNNITNNKCSVRSSLYSALQGAPGIFNFSTFINNNQTWSESFRFADDSNLLIQTISYLNVIRNKCGTNSNQVLFACRYTTNVDNCIFLNNTAKYTFQNQDENYTLTISDSYTDSKTSIGPGTVKFANLKEDYDFSAFSHIYTDECIIEYRISIKVSYPSKFVQTVFITI